MKNKNKKCPRARARSDDLIRDDSIARDTIKFARRPMHASHRTRARARNTIPEIVSHPRTRARAAVVGSIDRHTTAPPRSRTRRRVLWHHLLFIYTFSTACMEWHDGRTTRSKDARVVIEPVCF